MCLVLSVVAQPTLASRQGNSFGIAFKAAAEDTEAQVEHDGFDSSVMRVSWNVNLQVTSGGTLQVRQLLYQSRQC